MQSFATLQDEELRSLLDDNNKVEAVCHYCNKKYVFTGDDIEELIASRK